VTGWPSPAFLHPNPRVAEGQLLARLGVKAAIDISDGLISDLSHICQSSHAGARVAVDRLPVAPAVKASFGEESLELALVGGEDYELLFTASAETIEKITDEARCPVTVIGDITADKTGKIDLVDRRGKPFPLDKIGWDHFTCQ
jgi:thiamine-monophosphate kinase